MARSPVVVVGGGAAGVLTAAALLRRTNRPVLVVHDGPRLGPGIAHGTREPAHLLNSPAKAMGVDADDPGGFVTWCHGQGIAVGADDFAPRWLYGDYLDAIVRDAHQRYPGRIFWARDHVTALDRRLRVTTAQEVHRASAVILAPGNPPPATPAAVSAAARAHPGWYADPWSTQTYDQLHPEGSVLLIGTGLTTVDVLLALRTRGHHGPLRAVSRHGLLPRAHPPTPPVARTSWAVDPGWRTLRVILRQVRRAAQQDEWRTVVDRVRPHVNTLWAGLSVADRERFLRHVGRYWEVHRHRMPAPVADLVAGSGLVVHKGRLVSVEPAGPTLLARFADGGEQRCDAVVNCTGPGPSTSIPVVAGLVDAGLARPDPLRLGIEVDPDGRLVGRDGHAVTDVYAVGPLRRGLWFETTAIPELRAQATAVADRLS